MSTWTIVVAAGSGSRYGRLKQYEQLGDRRVLDWALGAARAISDGIVLVVPADALSRREKGVDATVPGGSTRSQSVRAGLAAVPPDAQVIVIHDGARPLASADLFERVVAAVRDGGADAAIPGVTPDATIKRVRANGHIAETLDRAQLVEVQTPQAFLADALRRAHATGRDATDDAALVEAAGGTVVVVDGETTNVKLTRAHDLEVARLLLDVSGRRA